MSDLRQALIVSGAKFDDAESTASVTVTGDDPPRDFGSVEREYEALTTRAGLAWLGRRTQIEFTGKDRAQYLHNLCTNEIRKLAPGSGCEAFITNVQGKTIGYGAIFVGPASIVFDTVPDQAERLLPHFERYLIREDVVIQDRTGEWTEFLVAGPEAANCLAPLLSSAGDNTLPQATWHHTEERLGSLAVRVRRVAWTRDGGFLVCLSQADGAADAWSQLASKIPPCGFAAFDAARIEAGTPLFGQDITDKNLPQEVDRDAQAISFIKGCYLGQETVARIDALGHVNRKLVGLTFASGSHPTAAQDLRHGSQPAGNVTSCAFSSRTESHVALGYVRREFTALGTQLESDAGGATVVRLPMD